MDVVILVLRSSLISTSGYSLEASRDDLPLEGSGSGTLPQNSYKPSLINSYPIKENPFGSAVSEILGYRQTNIQITERNPVTL